MIPADLQAPPDGGCSGDLCSCIELDAVVHV